MEDVRRVAEWNHKTIMRKSLLAVCLISWSAQCDSLTSPGLCLSVSVWHSVSLYVFLVFPSSNPLTWVETSQSTVSLSRTRSWQNVSLFDCQILLVVSGYCGYYVPNSIMNPTWCERVVVLSLCIP